MKSVYVILPHFMKLKSNKARSHDYLNLKSWDLIVTISELLEESPVNARIFTDILSNKATNAQTNMVILNAAFAIQAVTDIAHLQEAKNSRRSHSLGCCIS